MDSAQIDEIARGPKLTMEQLSAQMEKLRVDGVGILQCIKFVMTNQECSLGEAKKTVVNSDIWLDQREAFLQQQEDALQEFIDQNLDRIESIEQTITEDEVQTTVRLNPRN
jgi:hypothetical protein